MSLTATPGQETAAPVRRPHLGALSTCTLRHAGDDRLVDLARLGSERAFAEIMRRYQRPLQFYCFHLVGAARAEDAVQQAFMQAFVALRDGERREIALRPWLYRIARNCAIDLLRKQPFDHDELDPDYDGVPQTTGAYEQKEELARIVAAIQTLPEGQRRALTLRELEGRSYGEISAELGHTDSGVRQLIFRARTALRNLGALILPVGSFRWRFLGSSSAGIADPHQVATAASVSSTSSGAVQAAASVVAATATILGAGAPAHSHADRATAAPMAGPSLVSAPLGAPAPAASGSSSPSAGRNARKRSSESVAATGAPSDVAVAAPPAGAVPVAPAAAAPATPAPAGDAAPAVQPPAVVDVLGVPSPASAPAIEVPTAPAVAPASGATGPAGATSPAVKPPAAETAKPVSAPVKPVAKPAKPVTAPVKPAKPAAPKPASAKKPATPKAPTAPKIATPAP